MALPWLLIQYTDGIAPTPPPSHPAVGGARTRYRETTSYNRDRQRWEFLLEEIRDEEALPTKAKTAVAAVKRAKAAALDAIEAGNVEAAQAERLAQLYEAARSATKTREAIARANEAVAFAKELLSAMLDEDDDDIMLLIQ